MRLVILHYHIFKNAGTTIEDILDHSFGERLLPLDAPGLEAPISNERLVQRLRERPAVAAVSSHQIRYPLPLVPGFFFFDICFLRDPIERLRSTYDYYRQKPDPTDPMSDLAVRSNLRDFMAGMISDFQLYVKNVQVNLLACTGNSDEPEEGDLQLAIERFLETSFPGVVDLFDESVVAGEYALRRVFPELDCARPAANVSRGFEGGVAERSGQVREACGDEIYQELLRLNRLDLRLLDVARAEVRRRFQTVPNHEMRLERLSARRKNSPPAAPSTLPTSSATAPLRRPDLPTLLRRILKLARYLPELRKSRGVLFDPEYYRQSCPEARAGKSGAFLHFLLYGGFSGLAPHPLFDPAFYLARNPDVARAAVNPLAHYLKFGASEDRQPHPVFDPHFYLRHSPDVRASGQNPLLHYLLHGADEGRSPHPHFDPGYYRKSAHLSRSAGGNLLVHFLNRGRDAASPHPLFDCEAWLAAHPAVTGEVNPLVAYLSGAQKQPTPLAVSNPVGSLGWIAEPQQLPFLQALRPDQVRAQLL